MSQYILNKTKFETITERIKFPRRLNITAAGRDAIEADPNLEDQTISALWASEWSLLSEQEALVIETLAPREIADLVFYNNAECGLTHLALCIADDPNQSLAELAANYAIERQIPFFAAAWYIKALMMRQRLFYYSYSTASDLRRAAWSPVEKYYPPEVTMPPKKRRNRQPQSKAKEPIATTPPLTDIVLAPCKLCGSPGKIIRAGRGLANYTACCTDPDRRCTNFLGIGQSRTPEAAADAWNRAMQKQTSKKGR